MTKNTQTRFLSLVICIMLIAAMAFLITSCVKTDTVGTEFHFTFELTEGKAEYTETKDNTFLVKTSEETVGNALYALGLIDGDEGSYGLYIKSVNGIIADYDKDATYWAFYVDNSYAMSGASDTPIEEGKYYTFKIEK